MLRVTIALALLLAAPGTPEPDDYAECITDSCVGCIDDCLTHQSED